MSAPVDGGRGGHRSDAARWFSPDVRALSVFFSDFYARRLLPIFRYVSVNERTTPGVWSLWGTVWSKPATVAGGSQAGIDMDRGGSLAGWSALGCDAASSAWRAFGHGYDSDASP